MSCTFFFNHKEHLMLKIGAQNVVEKKKTHCPVTIHVISPDLGVFTRILDTFPDGPPICFAFRFAKKSIFMQFM